MKLFERRTRALILTEAGERYYREVSKALALVRDATSAVRAKTEPIVRVTTTASFASLWLVPRLAKFQADMAISQCMLSPITLCVIWSTTGWTWRSATARKMLSVPMRSACSESR